MSRLRQITFVTIALVGISQIHTAIAFAEIDRSWRPQLSEKILLLPLKHMNNAIEQDFSKSGLARNMTSVESQISDQVSAISELKKNLSLYSEQEKIEARHQIIVGKKSYIELLGKQIDLKRTRLNTKLVLLKRFDRTLSRDVLEQKAESELRQLQQDAKSRIESISAKLREQIAMEPLTPETNFSKEFDKNMLAINALKGAIANHRMQSQLGLDKGASKGDMLRQLMLDAEADLALVEIETELLGHMAHLLSLDAMALAEDVAITSFDVAAGGQTYSSPSDAVKLFTQ
jgi:hypothetical protein